MEIDALVLFVDFARAGSFAAAARNRGMDPSAVSQAIAGLEAQLGAPLFQRTTRAMVLKEAGALYLARPPAIPDGLAQFRDEAASMRSDPVGTLRLIAPSPSRSCAWCRTSRTSARPFPARGSNSC